MESNEYFNDICGRCRQVYFENRVNFDRPLAAGDRWSLFRGKVRANFGWAGLRLAVVDRWSLFGGGH
jgi:hypothetical protein